MNEYVLVFKRNRVSFPASGPFITSKGVLDEVLNAAEFAKRVEVERDPSILQVIPYTLMRFEDRVLSYRRTGAGDEERLHYCRSLGVGGHVSRDDFKSDDNSALAAIESARDREIREEFSVSLGPSPRFVGMILDDSDDVGSVHFGIVFECWLEEPVVSAKENALHIDSTLITKAEIQDHIEEYENWSKILIDDYLATSFR